MLEAIAAQRFASVLAPRAMGKSSLMGRTIRRLRAEGQLAAVVDLTQIGSRSDGVDSARWHYSIAYRIVRELRLKVELQAWWHDKSLLLGEQRLVEFFWDIVLANTSAPVTIFFDDAERAADTPFASELFGALHSCRMRRVSEPDFARLNFVVLGVAAPAQLCPDPGSSPFVDARAIELEEFTLAESKTLAPGFGFDADTTDSLLEQIHHWTRGQPYWTQKLARAVARKSGQLRTVDATVQELFLGPSVSQSEPLLAHMHQLLTGKSPRRRQALAILSRLGKGVKVSDDPESSAQQLLRLAGIIGSDENGMLRFRNRIVERVFGRNFLQARERPRWQRTAAMAVAAALLVLLPVWYLLVLPKPYVDYLSVVSRDTELAQEAHARLSRLPGFRARADRLLADAMVRHSAEATTIDELLAADRVLRSLPERAALADELKAGFWLRMSRSAARDGQRDLALIHALAAADGGVTEARPFAAELIARDYQALARSFPLPVAPLAFAVDWQRDAVVIVDDTHRVRRLPIDDSSMARNVTPADGASIASRLTALQHLDASRDLSVDGTGRAGAFQLRMRIEHGRPEDLLVRLSAPSGAAVEFELPPREGGIQQYALTATGDSVLTRLSAESLTGHWQLSVFDRRRGETGTLLSWGLSFPALPQYWPDDLFAGVPLPDPIRTEQVDITLARSGERAVAIPSRPGVGGALSVWDAANGELIADLPITAPPAAVEFIARDRLLTLRADRASLWQIGTASQLLELQPEGVFAGPPAIDPSGQHFALGQQQADGRSRVGIYRASDGERTAWFETDPWQDWLLTMDGAAVITIDGSRRGVVIDPASGEQVAEFIHSRALEKLVALPATDRVVAVDVRGDIVVWPLREATDRVSASESVLIGTTIDPASVDADGTDQAVSFAIAPGLISVRSLLDGAQLALVEHGAGLRPRTRISADGRRLVSVSDTMVRAWRLTRVEPSGSDFGDVSAVALSAEGDFAALGYRSGRVGWLDTGTATGPAVLGDEVGHGGVVTTLAVNRNRNLVASGGSDGIVRVWDTVTGAPRDFVLGHPGGPVSALALSSDGRWLVSAGPSSVRVWSLANGLTANEIEVDGAAIAVAFAPDSSLVAVGDSAGNIYLARPGVDDLSAVRSPSAVTALGFDSADAGRLASGGRDGTLVFWETATAMQIGPVKDFAESIRWLEWSGETDRVTVVSGSWLHVVESAASDQAAIAASHLLPEGMRSANVFARRDGRFLGIGLEGRGMLRQTDLDLAADAEADIPERNWNRVLGLRLDTDTGLVIPSIL